MASTKIFKKHFLARKNFGEWRKFWIWAGTIFFANFAREENIYSVSWPVHFFLSSRYACLIFVINGTSEGETREVAFKIEGIQPEVCKFRFWRKTKTKLTNLRLVAFKIEGIQPEVCKFRFCFSSSYFIPGLSPIIFSFKAL